MTIPDECENGHQYINFPCCPKCRIAELEEALRPIVMQWEECLKLAREESTEEAYFIGIPVKNKRMQEIAEMLGPGNAA